MKKTLLGLMLSVSLLAGAAVTANAAEDAPQTSNGEVTFQGGSITIDNGDTSTGTSAADLNFGTHDISTSDTGTYDNTNASAKVSVEDLRGTAAGWSLAVSQGTQFTSATSKKELTGAVITLNGVLDTTNSSTGADAKVNTGVALTPGTTATGTTTPIMTAASGTGNGTSVDNISASTLAVPTSTAKVSEAYNTTLTWELAATPSNS
ncbi:WxL domain-containing protein [Lactiplantibacillus dongliensis]|uniref:WxL domain-containing protein n=1 Tax=Lactiplantibacillus dongliensis TaxID=2559919 RepID=A0ABW1R835_9LACO|nr:WxL domain-containing protein [Lactiplantibacillus dongliensis]